MLLLRILGALTGVVLAAWLALATAGGLAAAAIFPASRSLPISLEGYEPFLAANPDLGRMLVAGHLVERVFVLSDTARPIVAILATALLGLVAFRGQPDGAATLRLRAAAFSAALLATGAAFAGSLHFQPAFQAVDSAYRSAARAGDSNEALRQKAAVDAGHAAASRVATIEALGVAVAIAAFAAAGAGRRHAEGPMEAARG